ncbi:hypothetical protein ACVWW7_004032 [Bradyrhizobium sp. LM6.9]
MVGFPLLLIPLAVYNIIAFLMPSVSFTDVLFKVPMITGEAWPVTLADVMLALGVVLLLLEVVKGARPGSKFLMDHLLSLIVFARGCGRIRDVAEIRQLHLFPFGAARDGRLPRRHRPAHAPPRRLCRRDCAGIAQGQAPG